jgi:5-oxopent-3-ene-1,2,5-tricarboxylate decarboxylase/2-hydroxyhepta-2,4-diene-1,7-dioate isomerase
MLNIEDTYVRLRNGVAPEDLPFTAARERLARSPGALPPVSGTVFGTLLNYAEALEALGDAVHQPPYKAPPRAPVLYIKPRNTHCGHGDTVPVPPEVEGFLAGAALGVVIGRTACRVPEHEALLHVAGYTIANDLTVPHDSFYRPSLRFKVRDRSCPMGPWVRASRHIADPDALAIRVLVDGELRQTASTAGLIRPVAKLLSEVSEFMTLAAGDVLLVGVPAGAPLARAGQTVTVQIDGIGALENRLVSEEDWMKGGAA